MLESLLTIEEARQYDGGLGSQAERVATNPLPTGEPDLGNSSVGTLFDDLASDAGLSGGVRFVLPPGALTRFIESAGA